MRRVVMLVAVMTLAACGDAPVVLTPDTTAATSTSEPSSGPTSTSVTTEPTVETTTQPAGPMLWSRDCTDQLGATDVEPVDAFAGLEFGPLAPEPGLRIVYPIGEQAESWSVPVSSVLRVPGGTLVSLTSSGPDGSERVVAVVDDSGSVRHATTRRPSGRRVRWRCSGST